MAEQQKLKITPAKGRPMLNWVGKKPLDYVKGFPAQLIEVFDPTRKESLRGEAEAISYNELKDNWHILLHPPAGKHWILSQENINKAMEEGRIIFTSSGLPRIKRYLDEKAGNYLGDLWIADKVCPLSANDSERLGFETQKPEALLECIIKVSSNSDNLILDCFIGSGTTAAVAQKLGRRWIGCDINKGAVQLTSKRLQNVILNEVKNLKKQDSSVALLPQNDRLCHSFAIFKVNNDEDRDVTSVCLGKGLVVDPWIEEWNKKHPVNKIKVIELKTDKKYGGFLIYKPAEARVKILRSAQNDKKAIIEIEDFISPTIIERFNIDNRLFKVKIPDFRCMIDTVLTDNNYDGKVFHIVYSDVPEKKDDLVKCKYEIDLPNPKSKVAVKIIDMLGEEVLFCG